MRDRLLIERRKARRFIAALVLAAPLLGCDGGGEAWVAEGFPPPFDAFQASLRLAVGMPQEVAIAAIGSLPIDGRVTHCGVLAAQSATCQVLRFGSSENNRLDVYVEATEDGLAVVSGWLVQKG